MPIEQTPEPQFIASIQQYHNGSVSIHLEPARFNKQYSFALARILFHRITQARLKGQESFKLNFTEAIEVDSIKMSLDTLVESVLLGK